MNGKKISAWAGGIIATGGALSVLLWGVPHYLQTEVSRLYKAEAEAAGAPPGVTNNTATIKAVQDQLASMDERMIARDKLQADRDAIIMQYFADKANGQ